jgi:hypothetical protein
MNSVLRESDSQEYNMKTNGVSYGYTAIYGTQAQNMDAIIWNLDAFSIEAFYTQFKLLIIWCVKYMSTRKRHDSK